MKHSVLVPVGCKCHTGIQIKPSVENNTGTKSIVRSLSRAMRSETQLHCSFGDTRHNDRIMRPCKNNKTGFLGFPLSLHSKGAGRKKSNFILLITLICLSNSRRR